MQYELTETIAGSHTFEGEPSSIEPGKSKLDIASSYLLRAAVQEWHEAFRLLSPEQRAEPHPNFIRGNATFPVSILIGNDASHAMKVSFYDFGAVEMQDEHVATLFEVTAWPQQVEMANTLKVTSRHDAKQTFVAQDLYVYLAYAKTYYLWLREQPEPQATVA
jgi:hypothetical protein